MTAAKPDTLLARFADAIDYPRGDFLARLDACRALCADESPEAAALLARFRAFASASDAGRLEELYTEAFDLGGDAAPWIGPHLFHDDARRGAFLARLAAAYRERGFSAGSELPDHLGVVLRYLAAHGGDEEGEELIALAALPAAEAVAAALGKRAHPWEPLARALVVALRARVPEVAAR